MTRTHPRRLPTVVAVATATALVGAASAQATEGPVATPPAGGPLPGGFTPFPVNPFPPAQPLRRAPRVILGARVVPSHVRRGRRAKLRLRLTAPTRLRITLTRRVNGRRARSDVLSVLAKRRRTTVRLPRSLRPGRYRIRIVAIDGLGVRSIPVRRTLVVRPRR